MPDYKPGDLLVLTNDGRSRFTRWMPKASLRQFFLFIDMGSLDNGHDKLVNGEPLVLMRDGAGTIWSARVGSVKKAER